MNPAIINEIEKIKDSNRIDGSIKEIYCDNCSQKLCNIITKFNIKILETKIVGECPYCHAYFKHNISGQFYIDSCSDDIILNNMIVDMENNTKHLIVKLEFIKRG